MEVLSTEMPVLFFLFVVCGFMLRVMRQEGCTGKWTQSILVFDCLIDIYLSLPTQLLRNLNLKFTASQQNFCAIQLFFFFFTHLKGTWQTTLAHLPQSNLKQRWWENGYREVRTQSREAAFDWWMEKGHQQDVSVDLVPADADLDVYAEASRDWLKYKEDLTLFSLRGLFWPHSDSALKSNAGFFQLQHFHWIT